MDHVRGIGRREAWQFAVVPVRREGDELEVLSTAAHAGRAMRFIRRVLGLRPRIRLVSEQVLADALRERFAFEGGPPPGMRPGSFDPGQAHLGDNGD
ncbi:MAG: hypothetical protein FJ292_07785 [Planctomycetes bacterium]|nr:hypothetical protein [Planctomycetota bacterium]